jgi:hypothetical protein
MNIKDIFTCILLLNFKLMSKKDETYILEQAQDLCTDLIFIEKKNFIKIKFWFEEEVVQIDEGKLIFIMYYYYKLRRGLL